MKEDFTLPTQGHVHLDAVGGVAGDMFVAALLDALPMLRTRVFADIDAVMPDDVGRPLLSEGSSGGLAVRRFGLLPDKKEMASAPVSNRMRDDAHNHSLPGRPLDAHRNGTRLVDLNASINAARLYPGTAAQAATILRRLAEAESRIHQVPLDEVHFHEVGDWDSLMDVVAAGSISAALAGWTWSVSELPQGGGLVQTRHGLLPVPTPATAELLTGFRWRDDGCTGERVTPTGAAILTHLVAEPTKALPSWTRLICSGMGAGTQDLLGIPNILRAMVYAFDTHRADDDDVIVVMFDIDDMSGEEIGIAADRLGAAAGVLDVSLGMRVGKKGRPVNDFRLLVVPTQLESVIELCLGETSTIGLRWHRARRHRLTRETGTLVVGGRTLRHKSVERPCGDRTVKVESDDLARVDTLAARRRLQVHVERGEGEYL